MTHNTRTRADVTAWSSGAVLPSEFDKLDQQAFQSINGDLGGVWAPSSAITIGGAGMVVTGLLWIQGVSGLLSYAPAQFQNTVQILNTLDVTLLLTAHAGAHVAGGTFVCDSPATFNSTADFEDDVTVHTSGFFLAGGSAQIGNDATKTLDVEATATFNAPVTANGGFDFFDTTTVHSGALFNAAGNVILGLDNTKTLAVAAAATFNASARFNQQTDFFGSDVILHTSTNLTVNGAANFNGPMALGDAGSDTIDVPGTLNLHGPLAYSFNGRVPSRPILAADTDNTYAVTDGNEIYYSNNIAADRHLTLSTSGAKSGDGFDVCLPNTGGGNGPTLTISDGTYVICLLRALGGNFAIARIRFAGGSWRLFYKT